MSQNVYQFIDLQRVDPPKKALKIRKIEFVEIYEPFSEGQAKAQAENRSEEHTSELQSRT